MNQLGAQSCMHCRRDYNQWQNIPKLLITCGHTLCECCCGQFHRGGKITCPQCFVDTCIESHVLLPKNLALLSGGEQQRVCFKHARKYEAYCQKENLLVCLDCILMDGHKTHEVLAIHQAYAKGAEKCNRKAGKIHAALEKIEGCMSGSLQNKQTTQSYFETYREGIRGLFRQIHQIVGKEEESILSRQSEIFTNHFNKMQEKDNKYREMHRQLQQKITEIQKIVNLDQFHFLKEISNKPSILIQSAINVEQQLKPITFIFNQKQILAGVTKKILVPSQRSKGKPPLPINIYDSVPSHNKSISQNNSAVYSNYNSGNNKIKGSRKSALMPQNANLKKPSQNEKLRQQQVNECEPSRLKTNEDSFKQSLYHSFISNMTWGVSQHKSIYIIGGFSQQSNSILRLSLPSLSFQEVVRLPSNRSKLGAVFHLGKIYMLGGKKSKERLSDGDIFDIQSSKWSKGPSLNKPRSGFGVIKIGQQLSIIGGNDGQTILSSFDTLNLHTGQWRRRESLQQARDELAVVRHKQCIYAIGGFGGKNNESLKSVEMYDGGKWVRLPPMKQGRRALAAAVLADGVYAIGGFDGQEYLQSVERYQQGDKGWIYVASMRKPRCTHAAVAVFDYQEIFVFGGYDCKPLSSVEKYSVVTDQWDNIVEMPQPRFMHSALIAEEY